MGPKMQEQMEVDILLRVQFNSIAPLMELSLPRGARESQVTAARHHFRVAYSD